MDLILIGIIPLVAYVSIKGKEKKSKNQEFWWVFEANVGRWKQSYHHNGLWDPFENHECWLIYIQDLFKKTALTVNFLS